jgi:hypothetical protein
VITNVVLSERLAAQVWGDGVRAGLLDRGAPRDDVGSTCQILREELGITAERSVHGSLLPCDRPELSLERLLELLGREHAPRVDVSESFANRS